MQFWSVTQLSKYQHVTYSELFCDILFCLNLLLQKVFHYPVSFLSSSGECLWNLQESQVASDSRVHTVELQVLKPRLKSIGSVHTVLRYLHLLIFKTFALNKSEEFEFYMSGFGMELSVNNLMARS